MQIAMDAASFKPSDADELRRAMGSKRSVARMEALKERLLTGMAGNGITPHVAGQIFDKLKMFADFGFPESHAFSFAYLVYASTWLKAHHPEAFFAGLLGAQPMGFYSPASLVADARRHGIAVRRPSVEDSRVHAHVEPVTDGGARGLVPRPTFADETWLQDRSRLTERAAEQESEADAATAEGTTWPLTETDRAFAVRLGLAPIRGIGERTAERIVAARAEHPFRDVADLARRAGLSATHLEALATGGALECFGGSRRQALWTAGALAGEAGRTRTTASGTWVQEVLEGTTVGLLAPELPGMTAVETAVADVWANGVSPDHHPVHFARSRLTTQKVWPVSALVGVEDGRRVEVGGVVTHRQRPGTARGVTFLSLEDETGMLNVVCSAGLWARHRRTAIRSRGLVVRGTIERTDGVVNLLADGMRTLSLAVATSSRDFQ